MFTNLLLWYPVPYFCFLFVLRYRDGKYILWINERQHNEGRYIFLKILWLHQGQFGTILCVNQKVWPKFRFTVIWQTPTRGLVSIVDDWRWNHKMYIQWLVLYDDKCCNVTDTYKNIYHMFPIEYYSSYIIDSQ